MKSDQRLFAFKLAAKNEKKNAKWVAREGLSAAGCTAYRWPGNVRYPHYQRGADQGVYC